jgi:peptide-methionine (S)-S-oxide reductase
MVLDKLFGKKHDMPTPDEALPGREEYAFDVPKTHAVNGNRIQPPFPEGTEAATFALGCFWGAERLFWQMDGVWSTFVGYRGGYTPHPTYKEVCTGRTGHAEVVRVTYDPDRISYGEILDRFWKMHDPTLVNRQGPDIGDQYRTVIFTHTPEQVEEAEASKVEQQKNFSQPIATSIEPATGFYMAEDYHQCYLEQRRTGGLLGQLLGR